MNRVDVLDLPSLVNWVVFRQGAVEGGFQGRTNKLVDGCYSFWQGGVFSLLQRMMPELISQQEGWHGPLLAASQGFSSTSDASNHDEESLNEASKASVRRGQEGQEGIVDGLPASSQKMEAFDLGEGSKASSNAQESRASGNGGKDEPEVKPEASTPHPSHIPMQHGVEREGAVTAEWLFPVTDTQIKRPPIAVTVEEVGGDETEGSVDVEKEKRTSRRPTVINQFMSTDDQLLYGPLFNAQALQGYILLCCQVLEGGLRDKPKKSADYYHTCYCLSGLTLAQDSASHRINAPPPPRAVLGPYSNLLEPVHPLCNVVLHRYYEAVRFFRHSPPVASYLG
jgi:hypothetical protein